MLTVPEAARRATRDPETIRRWIRSGRLAARKIGTQHVIEETDLEELIDVPSVARPPWLRRTSTGEPMPDALVFLRRQRRLH
jgi:excisionase family DNA binding protein